MFVRSVWVYGAKAFTSRQSFPEGVVPLREPEEVPVFDLEPKLVFQVDYPGCRKLTVEPVEVQLITRRHPEAQVRLIPVVH
ncbi:hypothetical protein SAMN06265365_11662 [Tistlia consotensis]|uniref:Uncharacterized protein n=1 Tax=Tistlia consotensis USBA 355 TaxID=560819 RepID=A0A1Y6C6U8_9PROT|nr:hypothetical protein [Tistlia consotensis]SMF48353.1 hypothetical protein SAMN05428998_11775 [Tistlia consotensis USBA 355]SNR81381.1 hypothetical protein SAMN06265365_11662 [Tistlia consotensis]